jgi:hypothetical protein
MTKRYQSGNQNPYIKEQTTQWNCLSFKSTRVDLDYWNISKVWIINWQNIINTPEYEIKGLSFWNYFFFDTVLYKLRRRWLRQRMGQFVRMGMSMICWKCTLQKHMLPQHSDDYICYMYIAPFVFGFVLEKISWFMTSKLYTCKVAYQFKPKMHCKWFLLHENLHFYTNFIVFDLTWSGLEPTVYHIRGEQANHYTTDAVN